MLSSIEMDGRCGLVLLEVEWGNDFDRSILDA